MRLNLHRSARWFVLVLVTVLVAGFWVFSTAAPASASGESTIHSLVNSSRAASGLKPLTLNPAMNQVAAGWANQMAANGEMSHNPAYSSQIPGGWSSAAENVAYGHASAAAVHAGWMASPGHQANILGDFTDVGIAHISSGGTTWSVEVFASYPSSAAPTEPAPSQKAEPAPETAPAPAPTSKATAEAKAAADAKAEAKNAAASDKVSLKPMEPAPETPFAASVSARDTFDVPPNDSAKMSAVSSVSDKNAAQAPLGLAVLIGGVIVAGGATALRALKPSGKHRLTGQ